MKAQSRLSVFVDVAIGFEPDRLRLSSDNLRPN